MSSDALAYLDDLNEEGRIEYDDYRNLHDLISAETPTDDEVEALRIAHLDARQAAYRKEREDWFVDHEAEPEIATNAFFRGWDAAVGGGFRRSEVVPEPSAEVVELRKQIEKLDADLGQQIDRTEELHDIADRLSWAIAPMSEIGEHSSANDPWENAIEYAASRQWCGGIHICSNAEHDHQEPQGEPSDAQESIRVASPDTWGWDACMVCGSKDVTDRGMMVLFSAKDGVYVSRVAWCDQSQECRDDLRQAGASMLTDQDAKSIDAALRAASTVTTPQGEPSDAQVNRDYLAQVIHKAVYSRIPLDDLTDEAQADTYKRADAVVAALRAAGGVR